MSFSTRQVVEYLIGYKMSQFGFPIYVRGAMGDMANSADIEAVKAALREFVDVVDPFLVQEFSDFFSEVDITVDMTYHNFKSMVDEVFNNEVEWTRVLALFAFGDALCVECLEKNMRELVPHIADWMTMYLDEDISPWIQNQGGWVTFAENFGNGFFADRRRSIEFQETLTRWLLVGVALLMGVLVGVVIAKRR